MTRLLAPVACRGKKGTQTVCGNGAYFAWPTLWSAAKFEAVEAAAEAAVETVMYV